MALGINYAAPSSDEERLPYVRYNAKAGRFYTVNRLQESDGSWSNDEKEVTLSFVAAFDFGSIETGWMLLSAGQAPVFAMAPLGKPIPAKPADKAQLGFRMKVMGRALGGIYELSGTSKALVESIDILHGDFLKAPEAADGKIPVVALVRTVDRKSQFKDDKGTMQQSVNYVPEWTIQQWVDRPSSLGERTVPPPGGPTLAQAAAHASSGSGGWGAKHVPPPAPHPNEPADIPEWVTHGAAAGGLTLPQTASVSANVRSPVMDDEIPF